MSATKRAEEYVNERTEEFGFEPPVQIWDSAVSARDFFPLRPFYFQKKR